MSRVLKCKAWDKNNKEWIDPALFAVIGNGGILLYRDGWTVTYEDIEIVEFTGLLDKNGREIYDGDVVKFQHLKNPEGKKLKGVFEWDKVRVGFGVRNLETSEHTDFIYSLEIIGNIYESPELINKEV